MLFHEDTLALTIDDVAIRVDQVTLVIDLAAHVVNVSVGLSATLQHDVAIGVFVEHTNDIFNIKALSTVV